MGPGRAALKQRFAISHPGDARLLAARSLIPYSVSYSVRTLLSFSKKETMNASAANATAEDETGDRADHQATSTKEIRSLSEKRLEASTFLACMLLIRDERQRGRSDRRLNRSKSFEPRASAHPSGSSQRFLHIQMDQRQAVIHGTDTPDSRAPKAHLGDIDLLNPLSTSSPLEHIKTHH
ncbi:hypothetical protein PENANT_c124G00996 [Penicillium antarcticum]|uniref:Uncharacterized protein n=1 Tax=Penicillium antarcticum TaxID=416450 RepID=A0A1V6PIC5_9EURO|nr:hypothetical protein PENANT_c124G00996 [Penicillium antarcticum]